MPAPASSNGAGAGASALTFQEAVARLQQYWAAQGCAVWVPHNSEARHSLLSSSWCSPSTASRRAVARLVVKRVLRSVKGITYAFSACVHVMSWLAHVWSK